MLLVTLRVGAGVGVGAASGCCAVAGVGVASGCRAVACADGPAVAFFSLADSSHMVVSLVEVSSWWAGSRLFVSRVCGCGGCW